MRESAIERYLVKRVKAAGGDCRKLKGRRNECDRLVIWPGREHAPEHRVVGELVHHVGRWQRIARDRHDLVEQGRGNDALAPQADELLDHQRQGHDGARNQRPDRPTGRLYDRKQGVVLGLP